MSASLGDSGKLLLRILVGGLMLFHGMDKALHGLRPVIHDLTSHGLPGALAYGTFVGEIVAPIFIIAGIWTRASALVYASSMVFATLLVHGADFAHLKPTGAWAAELWVFYIVTPLVVALIGPGRYAVHPR